MTPAAIIQRAAAEGVILASTPAGTIKATGNGDAVTRWLPVIREHKAELLAELKAENDAGYDALPDPAAEARRQRVLAMLAESPGISYAAVTDTLAVPGSVTLTLAVRHVGTVELLIPAEKWDGVLFLDLLERHGATVH